MGRSDGQAGRGSGRGHAVARLILVLVGGLLLAGCTPPNLPPPIAPTGGSAAPTAPMPPGTLIVGLDGAAGEITGFNPYTIADYSAASQAVTSLVLPSAFVMAPDGTVGTDPDVVDWVAVTSLKPFTVTYLLDRKAAWSDGTPITAEDFSYLWAELLVQPGTVASAGYRMISAIRSRNAGKTVEVEFAQPFEQWRTLFSPLLPSHLLKDSPGGWASALDDDLPLSANKYRMTSYDPVTGQVMLARNDKYWATQPGPSSLVLRLGAPDDLLAAFNRGDIQALWFSPDEKTAADLADQVPADRRTVLSTPSSVQLVLNTTAGPTANPDVRAAIAAGLVPAELASTLTAGWTDGAASVTSQVTLPIETGEPGSGGTELPVVTGDPAAARDDLARAGYTEGGVYVAKQGTVLRLTLRYPSGPPRTADTARAVQRQLGAIGIEVDLIPEAAPTLIESTLAAGDFELALVDLPRGAVDAVAAATAFGCPPSSPLGIGSAAESEAGTSTTRTADPDAGSDPDTGSDDGVDQVARTGNLSGYCQAATQDDLVAALLGTGPAAAADPRLWADLPVFPVIQPRSVFAVSPALRPVLDQPHAGWAWTGPLSGLAGWPTS